MSCHFTFEIPGPVTEAFNRVQSLITQQGGSLNGDTHAGSFTLPIPVLGKVRGTYAINQQTLTLDIAEKPLLLGCATIETTIREKFSGAGS